MEGNFPKGYVVLPVETYQEMVLHDIRELVQVEKASESQWSYGEVTVGLTPDGIRKVMECVQDKVDSEAILRAPSYMSATIARVPKEVMDHRLGKDVAEDESKVEGDE